MTFNGSLQIGLFLAALVVLVKPLGWYMAQVYEGRSLWIHRMLGPIERGLYRTCSVNATEEMTWKMYGLAMLMFSVVSILTLYGLQRLQFPAESSGLRRGGAGSLFQYCCQLRDEHQLASLRGRSNHELPDEHDRDDGAELPLCGHGNGHSGCPH